MSETVSPWVDASNWKTTWEVVDKLPGGGQGDAFCAKRRSDGKIGFLKTIKSSKDPERRARFFREASAYDSFGVDGIPRLIESNAHRHADTSILPFIVTEFIVGSTLRAWRNSQSAVSLETAVLMTEQLLEILHACHSKGCVHRDVKPDNIIVESGDAPRVWLLDFGISYHNLADTDFRTEEWQEVGNRFLRLPELAAGSRLKQDPRSDVCFAAGILFYIITGEHPDILEDSEGRLPHQRPTALAKLRQATSDRLPLVLALFDEAFATRMAYRFADVRAMQERIEKMMQDQPTQDSVESDLAVLREALDTKASQLLTKKIAKITEGMNQVYSVFSDLKQSIGGGLSISETGWSVTGEGGEYTLSWLRQGSDSVMLTVKYEVVPNGDEMVIRLDGETVCRTNLDYPEYDENFKRFIRRWLTSRLRAKL